MIRFTTLAFLFILFAGCATSEPEKPAIPEWMIHPPKSTADTLYGVGAGKSPDAAVGQALGSIAGQLYIHVESSITKSDHAIRFSGDETTRQEVLGFVKEEVKSLDFSTAKVTKNALVEEEYIVLASLDRKLLFTQQKVKLDTQVSEIEMALTAVEKRSAFEHFVQLHHAHQQRETILAHMEILHAIDNTFLIKRYAQFIDQIDQEYDTLKQNLHVQIISDAKAINFVTPIKNALSAEGIKVNNSLKQDGNVVSILLSASSQQDTVSQKKIVKIRLNISIKNTRQRLASATHTLHGKSTDSYAQARYQAADHLKNKIDSIGIFSVLGL